MQTHKIYKHFALNNGKNIENGSKFVKDEWINWQTSRLDFKQCVGGTATHLPKSSPSMQNHKLPCAFALIYSSVKTQKEE